LLKFITTHGWIPRKPIYLAAGLLIMAAVLMLTVVSAIQLSPPMANNAGKQPLPNHQSAQGQAPAVPLAPAAVTVSQPSAPATGTPTPTNKAKDPTSISPSQPPESVQALPKGDIKLGFGWQEHPVYHDWRYHTGLDIAAPAGEIVTALVDGEVIDLYQDRYSGLTATVKGPNFTLSYGSLAAASVAKGDIVAVGSKIGSVGKSAAEPYPHLHLAAYWNNQYHDPNELLR
jgi:murein DD-endopeptidase MepM/ murein hydrolase activator NlpD